MDKLKTTQNTFVEARNNARSNWTGIEHRLEWVKEWKEIEFINDSKATDVESVYYSLELMQKPVVWLCGNSEENENFWALEKLIKYKVTAAYGFGSNLKWKPEFIEWVDAFDNYKTQAEAFVAAVKKATPGTVVLLSPGNASYDQYANFKERGTEFKSLVAGL